MNRHHKLLLTDESYTRWIETLQNAMQSFQEKYSSAKHLLRNENERVLRRMRFVSNFLYAYSKPGIIDESRDPQITQHFYEDTLKTLLDLERSCEEHLLRMKINLQTAIDKRAEPPFNLSLRNIKKACGTFVTADSHDETDNKIPCRCFWENVPPWKLENIQNILGKPQETMQSEFDLSDVKFKQDMMYLRGKMLRLPRKLDDQSEGHKGARRLTMKQSQTDTFSEIRKEYDSFKSFSMKDELSKIHNLKFSDGKFVDSLLWMKALDLLGNQYSTKWYVVLCPQIEKILLERHIPTLHFNPRATFNFLSNIHENGANFILFKDDLIPLLQDDEESAWLSSWKLQLQTVHKQVIAAILIQTYYRGYMIRKKIKESHQLYIAANVLWLNWLTVQKKKEIYERYLRNMLISMQTTRELSLKLSKEFVAIINKPHVVLHLTSLGYPMELRRPYEPKRFAMIQNMNILKICFVRNPNSEVIYIMAAKPTPEMLTMYTDFIESMSQDKDIMKRICFVALSEGGTFRNRTLNVSRILHCSEESLREIRKKIAGKPAYFLPWVIDECDMRLAGNLGVALLSPDMEIQRKFLHRSNMASMIAAMGLSQAPYYGDIYNYETLCSMLARLIIDHTEVCVWTLKLNLGSLSKHRGKFLINHISIPFMPSIRKERERFGDEWGPSCEPRNTFLAKLQEHLPTVVADGTRLSRLFDSWNEFYVHIQKFGCLLQGTPRKKDGKKISVSLFVPKKGTKGKLKWLGTADILRLDLHISATNVFMMPQTSLNNSKLEPDINKCARGLQKEGYFGYMTIECYCYMDKHSDKLIVLMENVHPFYSYVQSYMDWMKFAIGGTYFSEKNHFVADIPRHTWKRVSSGYEQYLKAAPQWNETTDRYGIAICELVNSRFATYTWPKLKNLIEKCGIVYNSEKKEGSAILLHDAELRTHGLLVAVSPAMSTTISMVHEKLSLLQQVLAKTAKKIETNMTDLIDYFMKLSLDYNDDASQPCR
ncbi:IQ motif-containing protein H [Megalopta genalis]|uniref:IQ motif-containing protein H n=1 Tax=Megalopta genalis TaxID=115081 RepID=UPI003FCF2E15